MTDIGEIMVCDGRTSDGGTRWPDVTGVPTTSIRAAAEAVARIAAECGEYEDGDAITVRLGDETATVVVS